jgi:hypothetical protein
MNIHHRENVSFYTIINVITTVVILQFLLLLLFLILNGYLENVMRGGMGGGGRSGLLRLKIGTGGGLLCTR